ncbi:MAG TPA: peptidoglycan-binding protein [Candidatus Absconditabacterales bacterium]|nr:peptidoglycan-binding protein [Candidatus Absconditabacterales bacterium]HNG97005.1 peptidoglycan-binding protein [Candidatus Absconditabacterales bacterium]
MIQKQVILGIVCSTLCRGGISAYSSSLGCTDRLLKVTAYYTPSSDQGVYFNGDYETEKKINGGNWHGASGKHVYNGMLAGPKTYPFGTTVQLPGYGIGGVYDRGGAIVSTSGYDVIDIWAGSGLEGMIRALYRGSRMMTGTICSGGDITTNHGFDWSGFPSISQGIKNLIWTLNIQEGNRSVLVGIIQSWLQNLGFFPQDQSITNLFGPITKQALCNFQQQYLGLTSDDEYCGYYGTKTRKKFAELVKGGTLSFPLGLIEQFDKQTAKLSTNKIKKRRMLTVEKK